MIARLQQVHLVVDDIESQAKEMKSSYEASLEPFSANFEKLVGLYPNEFDRYRLDEIVVAAIAPVVRRSSGSSLCLTGTHRLSAGSAHANSVATVARPPSLRIWFPNVA